MPDPNLNQLLLEQVQAAQNSPPNSRERRRVLGELIRTLRSSQQLTRPKRGQFRGFYSDIYEEALQRLFTYICERIDDYNPERANVLGWVNFLLGQRFFNEASREYMATVPKGIDARTIKKVSVAELDREIISNSDAQSNSSLSDDLRNYIQEDPERVFQSTHVEGHPEVSYQWIALQRFSGYAWRELSDQSNIPTPTLSSFYQRYTKKFAPNIRRDLL